MGEEDEKHVDESDSMEARNLVASRLARENVLDISKDRERRQPTVCSKQLVC